MKVKTASELMNSVEMHQKQGKSSQKICYFHYCLLAQELIRKQIGPTKAQYGFPELVLAFIRDIAPGDIVGEIRENIYNVSLSVFCKMLGIQKIQCKNIYTFITYVKMEMPAQNCKITFEMLSKILLYLVLLIFITGTIITV